MKVTACQNKYICCINCKHSVKFLQEESKTNNDVCKKYQVKKQTKGKRKVSGKEMSLSFLPFPHKHICVVHTYKGVCACSTKLGLCSQYPSAFSPAPSLTISQLFLVFCRSIPQVVLNDSAPTGTIALPPESF